MTHVASPFRPKVVQPQLSHEMLNRARIDFELQPYVRRVDSHSCAYSACMAARMSAVDALPTDDADPTRHWEESIAHRCARSNVCDFCAIMSRTLQIVETSGSLLAMYIKYNEQTCTRPVCLNTIYEKYELMVKLVSREVAHVDMRTNLLAHPIWTHPKRTCFFYVRFVLCWQLALVDAQLRLRTFELEAAWLHARARSGESIDEAFGVLAALSCSKEAWRSVFVEGVPLVRVAYSVGDAAALSAEARLRRDALYRPGARGRCPSKYVALF